MIDVFYYSIAGKKANTTVTSVLVELLSADYIPDSDKKIIKHALKVSEKGNYPSREYFSSFYPQPEFTYSKLAEILTYVDSLKDFYKSQHIRSKVLKSINETATYQELVDALASVIETSSGSVDDFNEFKPTLYSDEEGKPRSEGIKTGITEIDDITSGFQEGTVGSICAFTGEGKSTCWSSILFKNALQGKKCVLVSLEMVPRITWLQLQARYLYEVKGVEVTAQDLLFHKLTSEKAIQVAKYDEDFRRDIQANVLIVDESVLSKSIIKDYRQISILYSKFQQSIGGLDMVIWDHVGQIELMFPDYGNIAIKAITSATKTWTSSKGTKVFTGLAVQCNREGRKRAARRNGQYDLQAISDLNEIERSCSYIVFLFTSEDAKILQETSVMMLKNRLGAVLSEPTTINFNPAIITVGSNVETLVATEEDFDSFAGGFDEGF